MATSTETTVDEAASAESNDAAPRFTARHRFARMTARKARLAADMVRGVRAGLALGGRIVLRNFRT